MAKVIRRRVLTARQALAMALLVAFSALFRRMFAAVSPHSGYQAPPMHGDFEAQRHWVEITGSLPLNQWYVGGPRNNLTYWGLDYPPLTAYHSCLLAYIASWRMQPAVYNASFGLEVSHGSETADTIQFMRESVMWSELVVYFTAAVGLAFVIGVELDPLQWCGDSDKKEGPDAEGNAVVPSTPPPHRVTILRLLMVLLNANLPLILIDHGHFQYNTVSLGLMVWSIYHAARHIACFERVSILIGESPKSIGSSGSFALLYHLWASIVLAALSMSFKQMSLYYSLGMAVWYLGECIRYAKWRAACVHHGHPSAVFVGALGSAVMSCAVAGLGTFSIVLSPFYWTGTLADVVSRVFPVGRGLYEDKVANFWCTMSPVIKLPAIAHRIAAVLTAGGDADAGARQVMVLACLTATIVGAAPLCFMTLRAALRFSPRELSPSTDANNYAHSWKQARLAAIRSQGRLEALLWTLVVSSLSFYLFSFQVHEKSILLPLVPATILIALSIQREEHSKAVDPRASVQHCAKRVLLWLFVLVAHASLFHLAQKDRLIVAFVFMLIVLCIITIRAVGELGRASSAYSGGDGVVRPSITLPWWQRSDRIARITFFAAVLIEILRLNFLEGHAKYPHLPILARFAVCCCVFLSILGTATMYGATSESGSEANVLVDSDKRKKK